MTPFQISSIYIQISTNTSKSEQHTIILNINTESRRKSEILQCRWNATMLVTVERYMKTFRCAILYFRSSASIFSMIFDERWAIYTYFAVCFWSGRSSKSTFSNEITVIIYCWALLALTFLHGMLIHVLFVVFYTLLVDGYSASLHRLLNMFSRCILFVHWWIFILCV